MSLHHKTWIQIKYWHIFFCLYKSAYIKFFNSHLFTMWLILQIYYSVSLTSWWLLVMHDVFSRVWLWSVIFQTDSVHLLTGSSFLQPWWTTPSFLCNDILRCVILEGGLLISIQIHLAASCSVTSACHPSRLFFSTPEHHYLWRVLPCHLAVNNQASWQPPTIYPTYTCMIWEEGATLRLIFMLYHMQTIPYPPFKQWVWLGWGGGWVYAGMTQWTHECHIIHQSVTGCRPPPPRDAVDL